MSIRWWSLACLGCMLLAGSLRAEERHLDFLNGLRELRYYDTALAFLDQLDARADLDPALKELLPYERAVTLLDGAAAERTPEAQLKQLDNAAGYLQQFLKQSPSHARAADANQQLAEVLVKKGRVEIIASRLPSNSAKKPEFLVRARALFTDARKMYQTAFDLYDAKLKSYKSFIDPMKEQAEYKEREDTRIQKIQSQYHLLLCTYDEAQTYEPEDAKRKELLLKAANDFEKMHQENRSVVAGLYARMHQGKCFEEMGDLVKALGIYNELLGHGEEETNPTLERLKDHVLHFKLVCLNHETKRDYVVVVQLATDWLKTHKDRALRTSTGLGIRWELARALEQLAVRGTQEKSRPKPNEKPKKGTEKGAEKPAEEETTVLAEASLGSPDSLYRQAESHVAYIARLPGEYREPASAMQKRIRLALGKGTGDPRDFDSAYQTAQDLTKALQGKRNEATAATNPAEKAKLTKAYADHVQETIRICKLALSLNGPVTADKKADRENEANRLRYWLSYAYYSHPTRSYAYDSALIGEYVARKYPKSDAARDAAYLSMNAWYQAYVTSDAYKRAAEDPLKSIEESKKNYDIQKLVAVATYMVETWPDHDKAQDARLFLGEMYLRMRMPTEAAKVFQAVPLGTAQYLDARMKAGIALWDAAASNSQFPPEQQLAPDVVKSHQAEARKILEESIKAQEAKQATDAKPGDGVTLAKLSLVQILNGTGEHDAAIKMISDGPKAVLVGANDMPGKTGDTIRIATRTELLRAFVGNKQVDKARAQLKELEKLGGTEGLTGILVNLGKELKKEIERLEAAKDPRLNEVLASFEAFLGDLAARKEGQDYGSLMWVGQTYYALGEGMEKSDPGKAGGYFTKSADAYQQLWDRGQSDAKFIPEGAGPGVQLKLISSRRREKKFDEAQKLMAELLKTNSNALDIQTEAAQVYQDRAAQGGPDDWQYWEKAINGDPPVGGKKLLWGWYEFGEKLRQSLMQPRLKPTQKVEYEAKFFDVRYNTAFCRLNYARNQPKDADKLEQYKRARGDVSYTSSQVENFGDRADYGKFNELYKTIQQENNDLLTKMGQVEKAQPVVELPKNTYVAGEAPPPDVTEEKPAVEEKVEEVAAKPAPKKAEPKQEDSGMMGLIIFALLLLGGGGVFGYLTFVKKPVKKVKPLASFDADPGFPGLPASPPPAPAPQKKPRPKTKTPE